MLAQDKIHYKNNRSETATFCSSKILCKTQVCETLKKLHTCIIFLQLHNIIILTELVHKKIILHYKAEYNNKFLSQN